MKLLVFSDIHGDAQALSQLMDTDADYYIAAGDLCSWGRGLGKMGEILKRRGPQVWVLPGNHESASMVESFCHHFGLSPLHERILPVGDYTLAGLGHSNPTPFNTPGEYTEEELEVRLATFSGSDKLILVCHCPPLGTDLDKTDKGEHCGSQAIATFIEQQQPQWFFCGHIHEAAGKETTIGSTRAVNVGKAGYLLEI
jgi:Icc-related predicted phosphoesterase